MNMNLYVFTQKKKQKNLTNIFTVTKVFNIHLSREQKQKGMQFNYKSTFSHKHM